MLAPMLTVATPTLQFGGIAGNFAAGVSRTVYVSGVVVEDQASDGGLELTISAAAAPTPGLAWVRRHAAVIGTAWRRVLGLCAALCVPGCRFCSRGPHLGSPDGVRLPDDRVARRNRGEGRRRRRAAPRRRGSKSSRQRARRAQLVTAVEVVAAEFQGIKELDDVYVGAPSRDAQRSCSARKPAAGDGDRDPAATYEDNCRRPALASRRCSPKQARRPRGARLRSR